MACQRRPTASASTWRPSRCVRRHPPGSFIGERLVPERCPPDRPSGPCASSHIEGAHATRGSTTAFSSASATGCWTWRTSLIGVTSSRRSRVSPERPRAGSAKSRAASALAGRCVLAGRHEPRRSSRRLLRHCGMHFVVIAVHIVFVGRRCRLRPALGGVCRRQAHPRASGSVAPTRSAERPPRELAAMKAAVAVSNGSCAELHACRRAAASSRGTRARWIDPFLSFRTRRLSLFGRRSHADRSRQRAQSRRSCRCRSASRSVHSSSERLWLSSHAEAMGLPVKRATLDPRERRDRQASPALRGRRGLLEQGDLRASRDRRVSRVTSQVRKVRKVRLAIPDRKARRDQRGRRARQDPKVPQEARRSCSAGPTRSTRADA